MVGEEVGGAVVGKFECGKVGRWWEEVGKFERFEKWDGTGMGTSNVQLPTSNGE
jgi:hypothetical protein